VARPREAVGCRTLICQKVDSGQLNDLTIRPGDPRHFPQTPSFVHKPFLSPGGDGLPVRFNNVVRAPEWRRTSQADLQERKDFGCESKTSPISETEFRDSTEGDPSTATTVVWPPFWD